MLGTESRSSKVKNYPTKKKKKKNSTIFFYYFLSLNTRLIISHQKIQKPQCTSKSDAENNSNSQIHTGQKMRPFYNNTHHRLFYMTTRTKGLRRKMCDVYAHRKVFSRAYNISRLVRGPLLPRDTAV